MHCASYPTLPQCIVYLCTPRGDRRRASRWALCIDRPRLPIPMHDASPPRAVLMHCASLRPAGTVAVAPDSPCIAPPCRSDALCITTPRATVAVAPDSPCIAPPGLMLRTPAGRYRCTMHHTSIGKGVRMPVIALLNQKGGVGKTSTCHHLAGTLAASGRRVLLLDNDPQASLTQGFWGPIATAELDPAATIAALYAGPAPFPEQVIRPAGVPGIDLVPGSKHATRYNVPEPHATPSRRSTCLRSFLEEIRDRYDLVLIDCPPNLHLCSWAALVASDHLIVPLQPEDYGAQGLGPVQESVDLVSTGPNPALRLLGFLLTMYNPRLTIHKLYETLLARAVRAAGLRHPDPLGRRLHGGHRPAEDRSPSTSPRGHAPRRSGRWPMRSTSGWPMHRASSPP